MLTFYQKLIKQSKVITHQPNKIKTYTEWEPADRKLQLDLIKIYILPPKNVHSVIKLKLVSPKKHDEHLSITRSSLKNKLFGITEEFKEFKFQQNL